MKKTPTPIAIASSAGTLGVLWLVYAILRAASALWIILYSGTLTLMWGALISRVANPFSWMTFFHVALGVVVALDVIACVVCVLAGITLLRLAPGGRLWGLVAAFFGLINGPLGIALGVFTVSVLLPRTIRPAYSDVATAA